MSIAIEFDFATREDKPIALEELRGSVETGKTCWVDLNLNDPDLVKSTLADFGLSVPLIDEVLRGKGVGRYDVHDDCLHVTVACPRIDSGRVHFELLDLIITSQVLFTIHRGSSKIVDKIQQEYRKFFRTFAQSLGFMLFEIWDALIETHRHVLLEIEEQVESTQQSIFIDGDDAIFSHVGEVTSDLLHLRKNVVAVRDSLSHLANHKSRFVPESTQPHLRNMVGMFDRLAGDLTVEREMLAEALTLYLGVVSHRTNRLLRQLTLVSVIFMPLMFLCGIYGMNLTLPEYGWQYGYIWFWVLATLLVTCMITLTRARKMW